MLLRTVAVFFGLAVLCVCFADAGESYNFWTKSKRKEPSGYGKPLFLTPYIKSGNLEEAKNRSRAGKIPGVAVDLVSYSGFFTVNQQYDSNMFFWFFPAINADADTPVILWLQGGPGMSGLFGLFAEHGPYAIDEKITAKVKQFHWPLSMHVIYVDNPVGTGFSFTRGDAAYPTNQFEVAKDLREFLQQFFTVYPEYLSNGFYVAGEGYGGKFAVSLVHLLHKLGSSPEINLKGLAVGNGLIDPDTMMDYTPYFSQLGLVDRKQAVAMQNLTDSIKDHLSRAEYMDALIGFNKLLVPFKALPHTSLFANYTGYKYFYNYYWGREPGDLNYYKSFINLPQVRKAMHVGNLTFQDGKVPQEHLLPDIMRGVPGEVPVILDNYKVLFYNGQLDLTVPYPLTENFLHSLEWKGAEAYKNAERKVWRLHDGGGVVGYVHNVGNFYEVLVRDCGQLVAYDQPESALDLMVRFTMEFPFA